MRSIGQIERLAPELHVKPFRNLERPVQAEIEILDTRAAQRIIARCPEARSGYGGISQGIEPGMRIAQNSNRGFDLVGTLVASRPTQGVTGRHGEWRAGIYAEEAVP